MKRIGWINGKWRKAKDLKLPIADRGINLSDGIFETILILNRRPILLEKHLNRWKKNACIMGMKNPPKENWLRYLIEIGIKKANIKNGSFRLNWSRGLSENRGIEISTEEDLSRYFFWLIINPGEPSFDPVSTIISTNEKRNPYSKLSIRKTFNYGQSIQSRREAREKGFDDALLLNVEGNICCGTTANILVKRQNNWLTPALNTGCLPGIMRQRGIDLDIIKETIIEVTPDDYDEWFLINSLSCHPIHKINTKELKISTNPKEFWLSLLESKK